MDTHYSQLELFSGGREPETVKADAKPRRFLFQVNRYEKTIFLLIGFIVTGMCFYCLGVEHGKKLAAQKMDRGLDMASSRPVEGTAAVVPAPVVRKIEAPVPVAAVAPMEASAAQKGSFTVQIGSYQGKDSAERERVKLVKKGLSPLIVKKGEFNIVCVGNFADKETARSLLSKLRQNYRDCYIRRL
jgi:hypothetical protein